MENPIILIQFNIALKLKLLLQKEMNPPAPKGKERTVESEFFGEKKEKRPHLICY